MIFGYYQIWSERAGGNAFGRVPDVLRQLDDCSMLAVSVRVNVRVC